MIVKGFEVKNILTFIKENLSIILIVPACIGGLWQAFELMNISIPYLRFFSLSQIVPDGLLILMTIVAAFIPMSFSFLMGFIDRLEKVKVKEDNTEVSEEDRIKAFNSFVKINAIFYILSAVAGVVWCIYLNFFEKINGKISVFNSYLVFAFIILVFCYQTLSNLFAMSESKKNNYFWFYRLFFFFLFYFMVSTICSKVHDNFLLTNNFLNIEKVNSIVNKKFPNSKSEILYFNDKYLFYKITSKKIINKDSKKPSEKIYIMELENIFND